MTTLHKLGAVVTGALALLSLAGAQWTPLVQQPTFTYGAGTALLLTDGSVLVHDESAWQNNALGSDWKRLTPDSKGNYVNGIWSVAGSMQSTYGPLYYASAVLADGRVVVLGGEYNLTQGKVFTNQGAIYDPVANTWNSLTGPGWANVGDAMATVLPNGHWLLANIFDMTTATLDPATLSWTVNGPNNKGDMNDEEGWTLLADGTMLTVDVWTPNRAEKMVLSTGQWIPAGLTLDTLPNADREMGPAVLRPDGTVIAFGASGHNGVYTPPANPLSPGTWTRAPDFPLLGGVQLDCADAPACLLPSGDVLVVASPGTYQNQCRFFEYDGVNLVPVPATPNSPFMSSYFGRMLLLPTGQVLFTDGSNDVEVYTPIGGPAFQWRPAIQSCPKVLKPATTVVITGTQFNGLSEAVAYGDDAQAATNYPLVRITNVASGNVRYCRTHDHSTMGVATKTQVVSTQVDIPSGIEYGPSNLEVVANGIASPPLSVNVANDAISGTINLQSWPQSPGGLLATFQVRQVGTFNTLDTETAYLDANGNFTFGTNLVDGTYDITAKVSHWLKRNLPAVQITGGVATGLSFSLLNGDVNGDNVVSLADFGLLRAAFGSSRRDPNYNPNADLNGDGTVSLADFGILRSNFGVAGDP